MSEPEKKADYIVSNWVLSSFGKLKDGLRQHAIGNRKEFPKLILLELLDDFVDAVDESEAKGNALLRE